MSSIPATSTRYENQNKESSSETSSKIVLSSRLLSNIEGESLESTDGPSDGNREGKRTGTAEGVPDGTRDGVLLVSTDGINERMSLGTTVGVSDGDSDGT